jgi:hypothetical protein
MPDLEERVKKLEERFDDLYQSTPSVGGVLSLDAQFRDLVQRVSHLESMLGNLPASADATHPEEAD